MKITSFAAIFGLLVLLLATFYSPEISLNAIAQSLTPAMYLPLVKGEPAIQITHVPRYGSNEESSGASHRKYRTLCP